jgi:hypothetical protein
MTMKVLKLCTSKFQPEPSKFQALHRGLVQSFGSTKTAPLDPQIESNTWCKQADPEMAIWAAPIIHDVRRTSIKLHDVDTNKGHLYGFQLSFHPQDPRIVPLPRS